jgi:hypothetical protein
MTARRLAAILAATSWATRASWARRRRGRRCLRAARGSPSDSVALVTHHNSDDMLHLVRLLGLGDEVAPERMEVDQRAPAARNHFLYAHRAAIFGELVRCAEGPFALRRGPLGDRILGEQVISATLTLGPSGHEVNERGIDRHPSGGRCQIKFYAACLRAGTRWSSTVFAHELSQRAASFEPENGLYSFALTMPAGGVRRFDDSQSASFVSHAVLSPRAESAAYSAKRAPCAWLRDVFIANAADRTAELSLARRRHGAAVRRSRIVRRWRQTRATACPELGSESTHPTSSHRRQRSAP